MKSHIYKSQIIENKSEYPYLTFFKKEPYDSFLQIKRRKVGNFYFSSYKKVIQYYQALSKVIVKDKSITLEDIYWFLLLRKYLREDREEHKEELFKIIKLCEMHEEGEVGFKISPTSTQKKPDIWSTYFAISSMKLLGMLSQYLMSKGQDHVRRELKRFILSHKKGDIFLHCRDKDCPIEKTEHHSITFYYVIELLFLIEVDVRAQKSSFLSFLEDRKKHELIVYRLMCLKYLDMDMEVSEKELEYLHEFQKEDGGYHFDSDTNKGDIETTFWIVNVLEAYAWMMDYNPFGVYSFISLKLNQFFAGIVEPNQSLLKEITQLLITLSIIWSKFIAEIERIIFRQLESNQYLDINQLKTSFGLTGPIEEIISYINLNYTFTLKVVDNKIEFAQFIRNLEAEKKEILNKFYDELYDKSIVSISKIYKKFEKKHKDLDFKVKEINSLIEEMMNKNIFKGKIVKKRFKRKYNFYLDFLLEKIIVCDSEINTERLYEEKEKLKDIKNDIYNMTLSLKNTTLKIREEIESYLFLNEISYAKERLKYVLRNALMDADFLNENIENSFNQDLYYINIQAVLRNEISQWKKAYSVLSNRLKDIDRYLKEKISEKEDLITIGKGLEEVEEKIFKFSDTINKKISDFRKYLRETLEKEYTDNKFYLITEEFEKIKKHVESFDTSIYKISQNITSKEERINKKHKQVIENWVSIKSELMEVFEYYTEGFQFFKETRNSIKSLEEEINTTIEKISNISQEKINNNLFQEAFEIIKEESDDLIKEISKEIKNLQKIVKKEIKKKQKLFLLFKYLQDELDELDENTIKRIATQVQSLKKNVIEERNRSQIKEFDDFVSQEISKLKQELENTKNILESRENLKVKEISEDFDSLKEKFEESQKEFSKKLDQCEDLIEDFDTKSKVTILQWDKFKDYFDNEVQDAENEYINKAITEQINVLASEKKRNNIQISELKKELRLKCNVIMDRIKEMINISKLNAELYEDEKCVLVYTDDYYKNRELRNFVDNKLMKKTNEAIGKILALYDSSVRNKTLSVNMLQLQNRIAEIINFEKPLKKEFESRIEAIQINRERKEFVETKEHFDTFIQKNKDTLRLMNENLILFNKLHNIINQEYNKLQLIVSKKFTKISELIEKKETYTKIQEHFGNQIERIQEDIKETREFIEEKLKNNLKESEETERLTAEIREHAVNVKNHFLNEFEEKKRKLENDLLILRNEWLRGDLINFINDKKIYLGQLLGTLQKRVEDNIEIKEFKKTNLMVQRRAKRIKSEIYSIKKEVANMLKEFKKRDSTFETKNKYVLENFNRFISEYSATLDEKIKTLERLVIKSYVQMAIKAVSNQYLTISFLASELKIKKQNIQEHLIFLISADKLKGKYDPRLGLYYENPEVLENLNEDELEVIKKMNFRMYVFLNRLKNFISEYYIIFAFFAAIISISSSLYTISGGNPAAVLGPIIVVLVIISVFLIKRRREIKESN